MVNRLNKQFVLASSNAGKIREIQALTADHGIEILPQSQFAVPDVEETGLTFVENAILKARQAALVSELPAIADDSGLEVDALGGAPGVRSARFAGEGASDEANNLKLLECLSDVPESGRTARFRCVMVFLRSADDAGPIIAQGVWEGRILREIRGNNGFGYDPLFWLPDRGCTSAELSSDEKNGLSHRGQALRSLMVQLFEK
jgi:XTP/dITP diphosphohydrolase